MRGNRTGPNIRIVGTIGVVAGVGRDAVRLTDFARPDDNGMVAAHPIQRPTFIRHRTIEASSCRDSRHPHRRRSARSLRCAIAAASCSPCRSQCARRCCSRTAARSKGDYAEIASVAEIPLAPKAQAGEVPRDAAVRDRRRPAAHVHPQHQVRQVLEQKSASDVRINIWQPVAERGGGVGRIGRATQRHAVRRIRPAHLRDAEHRGPLCRSCRASRKSRRCTPRSKASCGGPRPIVWDMRIATSSIPRETLSRILSTAVKPDDLEGRLQVVRLYLAKRALPRRRRTSWSKSSRTFPNARTCEQDVRQLRQLGAEADPEGDSTASDSRAAPAGPRICWRSFPPKASPAKRCSKSASCWTSTRPKTRAAKR